jgi:hypothetical protein
MPKRVNQLDLVAADLAQWIDAVANEISLAMLGGASAPFAARVTDEQKLEFYTHQLFNPDGSPNQPGRNQEIARLGPQGFRQVYAAVVKAHPELKPPEEAGAPELPPPGPPSGMPIRAMASGGIVTQPTVALIGEAGPEMVVPLPQYQPPQYTPEQSLANLGTGFAPGQQPPQPGEIQTYIDQAARARGIDPAVAMAVAYHEGGRDPSNPNQPAFTDPAVRGSFNTGSSWWPFQLHYGGPGYAQYGTTPGMGNDFTRQTGYQPGDPAAWRASVDYALDQAMKTGWTPWYGSRPAQVSQWQGLPQQRG